MENFKHLYVCVCKEVDGVESHLFYCIESKKFFKSWMIANLNCGLNSPSAKYFLDSRWGSHNFCKLNLYLIGKCFLNNSKTK